jgi:hypothetical protein
MSFRRFSIAALFVLTGCPTTPAPTTTGPVPFDDFPAEAARANCQLLFDCCTADEVSGIFTPGVTVSTEAECRAYFEMLFRSEATAAEPGITSGSLLWNADAAGECVAMIDGASCPDVVMGVVAQPISASFDPGSACVMRLGGTTADGASCSADLDCASGYCGGDPGSATCAQLPTVDEPCTTRCAEGLGCDVRATTPTCVVRRPDGGTCTPGFGDVCESRNCNAPGTCGPTAPIMRCTGMR